MPRARFTRLASRLLGALLAFLVFAIPRQASAQSCHALAPSVRDDASFQVSLATAFATYRNESFAGEYQGLILSGQLRQRRLQVAAALPAYRLVRNGLVAYGLGDVAAQVRVAFFQADDASFASGADMALTAPSGDANEQLGMGHVMLMPAWFIQRQHGPVSIEGRIGYGRSIDRGNSTGHQHGATGPLVSPMNRSEVEHALFVGYALGDHAQAMLRLSGAIPVAASDGEARESIGLGLSVRAGPLQVSVETARPLVGSPFLAKTTIGAALGW